MLVGKLQVKKSVYGVSTGLEGSGACHTLISHVRSKAPYHHILDRAKTCRTATGYSGHADEPHDRPRPRPHTTSPHRTSFPSTTSGLASGTSADRPACREEHARGVGPWRDLVCNVFFKGCYTPDEGHRLVMFLSRFATTLTDSVWCTAGTTLAARRLACSCRSHRNHTVPAPHGWDDDDNDGRGLILNAQESQLSHIRDLHPDIVPTRSRMNH